MEKQYSKKQMTAVGFVIAIVTAAVMLFLQIFGVTTPDQPKAEKQPQAQQQPVNPRK